MTDGARWSVVSDRRDGWVMINPASFRIGSGYTLFMLSGWDAECRMTWN